MRKHRKTARIEDVKKARRLLAYRNGITPVIPLEVEELEPTEWERYESQREDEAKQGDL